MQVADTGPGMPADGRAHAIHPVLTTKEGGEGTGRGLGLSRRIVGDSYGGGIALDSGPAGTLVEVRLPARRRR